MGVGTCKRMIQVTSSLCSDFQYVEAEGRGIFSFSCLVVINLNLILLISSHTLNHTYTHTLIILIPSYSHVRILCKKSLFFSIFYTFLFCFVLFPFIGKLSCITLPFSVSTYSDVKFCSEKRIKTPRELTWFSTLELLQ